ncbi:hypothetical protein CEXT_56931 [Caerostris extrusa]|uniref:Uncharacterized protein n=1 Tax=Caerostris extrusa TaxID=172846 RepID=A0AAV4QST9_CAEEX|nr:hypothetical protein CEXT_56931 [Caerostris extrusa]
MHPKSNRSLRMWRTSAHRSAMMGLCSGIPFMIRDDSSARDGEWHWLGVECQGAGMARVRMAMCENG